MYIDEVVFDVDYDDFAESKDDGKPEDVAEFITIGIDTRAIGSH